MQIRVDRENEMALSQRSQKKGDGRAAATVGGLIRGVVSGILKVFLFLTIMSVVSISFLSLYNYLLASPYMKLEQVNVKGAHPKLRNELIHMCGLNNGPGLLSLQLYELKKKMEAHPWIRTVKLERRFPHTLIIEVEKQTPVALIHMDNFYYVNGRAEIFKRVSTSDDIDLPVITGISKETKHLDRELKKAAHVLRVLASEQGTWSLPQVSEIHLDRDGSGSLYFSRLKAEVRFKWNELAAKMDALKQIADHLDASGKMNLVTCINLNYAEGAVVSFEGSG